MRFLIISLLALTIVCCTKTGGFDIVETDNIDSLKFMLKDQELTDKKRMLINGVLGINYNMLSKYDSARFCLNEALSLPGGREYEGGRLLTNLANSYGFQGQYAEALKHYLEALKVSENLANTKKEEYMGRLNVMRVMANLSEIYYLTGNRKHALFYAEEAKKTSEVVGINYITPQYLYIIGSIYLEMGELDKAEKVMSEAFVVTDSICRLILNDWGKPLGSYMYMAYCKEGLAQIYLARKDYAEAIKYAAEAMDFAERNGDPSVTAKITSAFSDIYHAQGNYKESGRFARKALEIYPGYSKLNPNVLFNIANSLMFDGDREGANKYFHLYSAKMKENTDKQFRETMAGMEAMYEFEKKEIRISDLERQNVMYIFIGIAGILLATAIWIILRQKIKTERKEKQLIAANAILEWEKKERKRFASDLHDGINGILSALKFELNAVEHLQKIRDQLDDCVETIRRMARGMMPCSLERYGLKAALEDYCRLFPNVFFYFYGKEKRINERIELVVYYCAYELVNNSFRHSGAEKINVQLVQTVNTVSVTVQDNGCGFDNQSTVEGAGLKSIRERVKTFNGIIDIYTSPGNGTDTTIELKIEN